MDRPIPRENPQEQRPETKFNKKPEVADGLYQEAAPPLPGAQSENLGELGDIPEAPRREPTQNVESGPKGPLLPANIEDFVRIIGEYGKSASLNAETSKMAEKALREAKKNQN